MTSAVSSGKDLSKGSDAEGDLQRPGRESDHFSPDDWYKCCRDGQVESGAQGVSDQHDQTKVICHQRSVPPFLSTKLDGGIDQKRIDDHPLRKNQLVQRSRPVHEAKDCLPGDVEAETVDGHAVRLVLEAPDGHENVRDRPEESRQRSQGIRHCLRMPVRRNN